MSNNTTQRVAINLTAFCQPGRGLDAAAIMQIVTISPEIAALRPILLLQLSTACAARVLNELDERDLLDLFPVRATISPRVPFPQAIDGLGIDILLDARAINIADTLTSSRNLNRAVQISSDKSRDLARRFKGRYSHAQNIAQAIRNL